MIESEYKIAISSESEDRIIQVSGSTDQGEIKVARADDQSYLPANYEDLQPGSDYQIIEEDPDIIEVHTREIFREIEDGRYSISREGRWTVNIRARLGGSSRDLAYMTENIEDIGLTAGQILENYTSDLE